MALRDGMTTEKSQIYRGDRVLGGYGAAVVGSGAAARLRSERQADSPSTVASMTITVVRRFNIGLVVVTGELYRHSGATTMRVTDGLYSCIIS